LKRLALFEAAGVVAQKLACALNQTGKAKLNQVNMMR